MFRQCVACRENGVGYLDLTQPQDPSPIYANLIKSDGSTLYLTRYIVRHSVEMMWN